MRLQRPHIVVAHLAFLGLLTAFRVFPLSVDLVPILPPVITNVDLSQYDIYGTGITQPMFSVRIDNSGDTAHTALRLRYAMYFVEGSSQQKLFEGLSNTFGLAPNEVIIERSSDFLLKNNPSVKVSMKYTLYEVSDEEFKRRVLESQKVPNGTLRYELSIETIQNVSLDQDQFECFVLNATRIELISPGAEPSGPLPIVGDPNPVFIWTSDLGSVSYTSGDVFEVRVYKARSGESMAEATGRSPVMRIRTSVQQAAYPTAGEQLIAGVTYYWQVIGFLKGLTTSQIESSIFGFKMVQPVNARLDEVLALLRQIYDEATIEKVLDYSADVTIRIDGKSADIEELRALVQKILMQQAELKSTSVY